MRCRAQGRGSMPPSTGVSWTTCCLHSPGQPSHWPWAHSQHFSPHWENLPALLSKRRKKELGDLQVASWHLLESPLGPQS